MIEKEIMINGDNPIYGTLTIPAEDGKYPAVLILPGSGPIDRNGNDRKGKFQTNLYKELAHFIGDLGFATLRVDKRGTGKRDGDWMTAGLSDLIDDAKKAFTFLKTQPNVDENRVVVCGHSEGTIHATELAQSMNPAGAIFLSGGVDNLMQALKGQRLQLYKELMATPGFKGWLNRKLKVDVKSEQKSEKFITKICNSDKDIIKIAFFIKQPAKYFREHNAFNTRKALKNVTCPVLAIQGDKDPLVDNSVLSELSELVQGKSEYHIIPNMEHGLKIQTEAKSILYHKKNFKYLLKQPFNQDGLEKLSSWLTTNFITQEHIQPDQTEDNLLVK
jgi:uncharacterized protein